MQMSFFDNPATIQEFDPTPLEWAIKKEINKMEIAKLDDIDREFAARAFHGTSFSPEKRGESRRREYVEAVNGLYAELMPLAKTDEQKALLADEMERYRQGYLKRMNAYLGSHANVISFMITGPANFPVARNEKRSRWADNKANELYEWDKKAQAAIKRNLLDARPQEVKDQAELDALMRDINSSLNAVDGIDAGSLPYHRHAFTNSVAGKLERLANNGDIVKVKYALEQIEKRQANLKKPYFTKRHKIWRFADYAELEVEAQAALPDTELLAEREGFRIERNNRLDRIMIFFDEIPSQEMRDKLKSAAWKWSPKNQAWQRKITNNAIYSVKRIMEV